MTRFSFQQIDRPGAKWGIKASGDLGQATKFAGRTVTVSKRDGSTKEVTLGARLDAWNGGRAAVYAIAKSVPCSPPRGYDRERVIT